MTVRELKELLEDLPEDMEIIMQKDGEGNGYSPLSGADPDSIYIADSTRSGDVYSTDWSAYDVDMDEEDWEEMKETNPRCLVLYPVN